jgi:hypothetical protein
VTKRYLTFSCANGAASALCRESLSLGDSDLRAQVLLELTRIFTRSRGSTGSTVLMMRYHTLEFGSTCDRSAATARQSGSCLMGNRRASGTSDVWKRRRNGTGPQCCQQIRSCLGLPSAALAPMFTDDFAGKLGTERLFKVCKKGFAFALQPPLLIRLHFD